LQAMERKDPSDKPRCRQPTNAGPTDRLPFSFGVAVSDRRRLASAPSWQRHLRHDPAVETLRDRGLRFAANSADAGSRNLDCDIAAGVTGLFDG
jgi:hypothetical protein